MLVVDLLCYLPKFAGKYSRKASFKKSCVRFSSCVKPSGSLRERSTVKCKKGRKKKALIHNRESGLLNSRRIAMTTETLALISPGESRSQILLTDEKDSDTVSFSVNIRKI